MDTSLINLAKSAQGLELNCWEDEDEKKKIRR